MNTTTRIYTRVLLAVVALASSAYAAAVTVPVSSSDTAAWIISPGGGTGTSVPNGGPAIWNSQFSATIPAGATNIRFTLNSFTADDKGVIQLNGGSPIADDTTGVSNGAAAGAGTFDFGGGDAPYTFVGFTPGASSSLPNGTTSFSLLVSINDTGVTNPSAPPLSQAFISDFTLTGTLDYDEAIAPPVAAAPVPVMPVFMLLMMCAVMSCIGLRRLKTKY
jgi:hypothetical protein